jgi:ParB/RepB/Spo0J family partition protein
MATKVKKSTNYVVAAAAVLVPLAEIIRGDNDRKVFDAAELAELAESLKTDGLKQPITIRPRTSSYEIVAGERRYLAAALAGWTTIPAFIEAMDDDQAARVMFLENFDRVDLSPIEEGGVYAKWINKLGWDLARVVRESNKSADRVSKRLALLDLIAEVQLLVVSKALPLGHAEAMVMCTGADGRREPLNAWSQSQVIKALGNAAKMPAIVEWRQMVGELLAAQAQSTMFDLDAWTVAIASGAKKVKATGLAKHPSMPRLVANRNTGKSLLAYIDALKAAGLEVEALAISHVLDELIIGNLTEI